MLAAVALAAAGCAADGGDRPTGPSPPDRLSVTLHGGGFGGFRVELECVVADRGPCAEILDALRALDEDERCSPLAGRDGRAELDGTIGGDEVRAVVARRTDCEERAYARVVAALGLGAPDQPASTSAAPTRPGATASAAASAISS